MAQRNWFEISNEGWRRLNAGRPLSTLLREAVQNSLDQGVQTVDIWLGRNEVIIEDDSKSGFSDERLIYTVFLSDKVDSPTKRGRKGRGLKELISAMDRAVVETIGHTVTFDSRGRSVWENKRGCGTRLVLQRNIKGWEIDEATQALHLIIPPRGVRIRVNGEKVCRPRLFLTLAPVLLESVVTRDGVERVIHRATELTLYHRGGNSAHLFEMGLPIEQIHLPWHVDVAQRIPLSDGRDHVEESYKLNVYRTLFQVLVTEHLPAQSLRDDWIQAVLARADLSEESLRAYVSRVFPDNAVLSGTQAADDRARQLGAVIVDGNSMSRGVHASLSRVLANSDHFVRQRDICVEEKVEDLSTEQERTLAFYGFLAKAILGRHIDVEVIRKQPNIEGYVEDATFHRGHGRLKINILGKLDLSDPLAPQSLGLLFHELAHNFATDHDLEFIRSLELIAGKGAAILAALGPELVERFGLRTLQ